MAMCGVLSDSVDQSPLSAEAKALVAALEVATDQLPVGGVVDLDQLLSQFLAILPLGAEVVDGVNAALDGEHGVAHTFLGQVVSAALFEGALQHWRHVSVVINSVVAEADLFVCDLADHAVGADQLLGVDHRFGRPLIAVVISEHQVVNRAIFFANDVLDAELGAGVLGHQCLLVKALGELGHHVEGCAMVKGSNQVEADLLLRSQGELLHELDESRWIGRLAHVAVSGELLEVVATEPAPEVVVLDHDWPIGTIHERIAVCVFEGVVDLGSDNLEVAVNGLEDLAWGVIRANDDVVAVEEPQIRVVELGLGLDEGGVERRSDGHG